MVYVETWPSKRMTVSSLILKGGEDYCLKQNRNFTHDALQDLRTEFHKSTFRQHQKKHVYFQIIVRAVWYTECQWNFV